MKITSLETNAESKSSNANAMAVESAKVSENERASDEKMEVPENEIALDEEMVSQNVNVNEEIADDMPLCLYMPKMKKRKRKTRVESSSSTDGILEYMLHTTINVIKLGPSKRTRNDEETSFEDLPQKSFPPVYNLHSRPRGAKTR
ncbi:hypothetical protein ZOSMA_194G00190 [Zostera marina]|uniref:Uncharacterized protein n=1 Tax=Zostera marina TaxID=29655 RepID=A0A0K9PP64_ZOSMR|nr:hypothetical protein ZOSMA_194G00190 [Zostera marina]